MNYLVYFILLFSSVFASALPLTTSGLNGFDGIKVQHLSDGKCQLSFPKGYGLSERQLINLVQMSNNLVEHDIGCMAPSAYHALNQIRRLATEEQNDSAADLLLKNKFDGLGVSISEGFTEEYQIPVLLKYRKAKEYLSRYPDIAKNMPLSLVHAICSEWGYSKESVKSLIDGLKSNGLDYLANNFKEECDDELERNPHI